MTTTQTSGITSSNRVAVRRVKETAWGVTPSTPTLKEMRVTGSDFSQNFSTGSSNEVRADRMNAGVSIRSSDAGGSVNLELSFGSFDDEIEAALFDEFGTVTALTGEVTIAATATGFTDSGSGFGDLVVGQWIKVDGFTNSSGANNGYYKVTAAAAGTISTTPAPNGTESAGDAVNVSGKMCRNGTVGTSFTIQEQYLDHQPTSYVNNSGMYVDTFSLSIQNGSDITGSIGYKGKNSQPTQSQFASASLQTPNTNAIMDAISSVQNVMIDGVADDEYFTSLKMDLKNNQANQSAVGQGTDAVGVRVGKLDITVSFDIYFRSLTELQDYAAKAAKSLSWRMEDADGNAIIVTLPKGRYSAFKPTGAGNNGDAKATGTFTAEVDSTGTYQIQIDSLAAL